jgi:hypothetical protein
MSFFVVSNFMSKVNENLLEFFLIRTSRVEKFTIIVLANPIKAENSRIHFSKQFIKTMNGWYS